MLSAAHAAPVTANADQVALEASVAKFINTWDSNKPPYKVAFYDLNWDSTPEAIVYVQDRNWCGSGGCTALILQQHKQQWRIVTKLGVTNLPITVLKSSHKGWHNLSVRAEGGGIAQGYDVLLSFNGKSYPKNPTLLSAASAKKLEGRTVLIAAEPVTGQ